jgi:hypothetical protein
MSKLKMKPIGGCISPNENDSVCSSHMNTSKHIQWLPKNYVGDYDFDMYIDGNILSGLNNNPNKYGWLLESRGYNQGVIDVILKNLQQFQNNYKFIFTCQMDLVQIGHPFYYAISNAAPWTLSENRKRHTKYRMISMLVSKNYTLAGHKYRVEYAVDNKNKLNLYGRGQENEPKITDDAYKNYNFTVSMENDVSDAYFTERLTSPMTTYTVPIYRGSKSVVEQYFNPKGVIFSDNFNLNDCTDDLYNSMMPYIEENFKIACEFPVADDYIAENYLL